MSQVKNPHKTTISGKHIGNVQKQKTYKLFWKKTCKGNTKSVIWQLLYRRFDGRTLLSTELHRISYDRDICSRNFNSNEFCKAFSANTLSVGHGWIVTTYDLFPMGILKHSMGHMCPTGSKRDNSCDNTLEGRLTLVLCWYQCRNVSEATWRNNIDII